MIDTLDFVTGVPYQVAPQYTQMHIIDELNVRHGLGSSIIIDSPDTVFDVLPTHDARTRLTAHLQNWANIRGNPIYFILNADNFGRLEDIASSNNQLPNIIR
ncbi:MAG: hypothetical protein NDI94_03490, partial [Candidatus Woesearchaeota archaeon]|nr:hypothetical protein [Candidatus Woesearchaeota archaeon]